VFGSTFVRGGNGVLAQPLSKVERVFFGSTFVKGGKSVFWLNLF